DSPAMRRFGRALVRAMPRVLVVLSAMGTVAMLWVGGGIILHGLEHLGVHGLPDAVEHVRRIVTAATGGLGGVLGWVSYAVMSALAALVLGVAIAFFVHKVLKIGGH